MPTNRIVVIGDIMLDQYHFGQVTRLNPESPNPLLSISSSENRLGGAANTAANLAALGNQTMLIGNRGDDTHGNIVQELCKEKGITLLPIHTREPTITKTRFVEMTYNQQLLRADFEEKIHCTHEQHEQIIQHLLDYAPAYVVISDYNKGVLSPELIDLLGQQDIKLLVDTKPQKVWLYKNMFLLKPNFKEFKEMIGKDIPNTDEEVEKYGTELVKQLKCHLVITRGKEGASLITKEGAYLHIPTDAQTVFDVSGAGDTFMAGLVTGLLQELPLPDAVKLANKASGIAVSKLGTAIVSREELSAA